MPKAIVKAIVPTIAPPMTAGTFPELETTNSKPEDVLATALEPVSLPFAVAVMN
jgi:hypothetical protein